MARRKRPAISQSDRRKWLEKLESGIGITRIAKQGHRDIRIVKRNIDIAQEERALASARHDFLLKRMEQHQEDLLAEVARLQERAAHRPPTTLVPGDSDQAKMFSALKEHTKRSTIETLMNQREEAFTRYSSLKQQVFDALDNQQSILVSRIGASCYQWAYGTVDALESGRSLEDLKRYYQKELAGDRKYKVSCGDRILTRSSVTAEQAERVIDAHQKVLKLAVKYPSDFQKHLGELKELSSLLIDELDIFKLRRIVKGRCRYCPDQK